MSTWTLTQTPALQWNWPRVGALSGTMALHLIAVALLLIPPTMVTLLLLPPAAPTIVRWIEPQPEPVEVPLPTPPRFVRAETRPRPRVLPVPAPAPHEVIADTTSAWPVPADLTPVATDRAIEASVADAAPTALAYHTRTPVAYPPDALRLREHGTVILSVLVGADGIPQTVEIEKSSGSPRLDGAARDAVKRWTFQPGTRAGVASALWARVPIAFNLQAL